MDAPRYCAWLLLTATLMLLSHRCGYLLGLREGFFLGSLRVPAVGPKPVTPK